MTLKGGGGQKKIKIFPLLEKGKITFKEGRG